MIPLKCCNRIWMNGLVNTTRLVSTAASIAAESPPCKHFQTLCNLQKTKCCSIVPLFPNKRKYDKTSGEIVTSTCKKKYIIISGIFIITLSSCSLRAKRSLSQAVVLSKNKVSQLQQIILSDKIFKIQLLKDIFYQDTFNTENQIEKKLRSFYKVDPSIKVSLLGELIKFACNDIASYDLNKDCYFLRSAVPERDFEYIEGILLKKTTNNSKKIIFLKVGIINGKIDIENSIYNGEPLKKYLSILDSGKISNLKYEKHIKDLISRIKEKT